MVIINIIMTSTITNATTMTIIIILIIRKRIGIKMIE